MITQEQKDRAYNALRTAGFEPPMVRELLAGPKGLRDEMAMAAITGTLPGANVPDADVAAYGRWAYRMADAMMAERGGK